MKRLFGESHSIRKRALPGGPVALHAYKRIKSEMVEALQRLQASSQLDGVFLGLHGAMFVEVCCWT